MTRPRQCFRLFLLCALLLLAACTHHGSPPRYVPPGERPVAVTDAPWQPGQFLAIAYHEVEDRQADQTFLSVRSDQLVEQLNWLHENGYQAVSIDQILAARAGITPLPDKAVLLSFDDGFGNFYSHILPILKAFRWPAVLAPVGVWMDAEPDEPVDFGGIMVERRRFLNWEQIAEIAASGLVEIAAHTNHSHHGIIANPQGTRQPAAAVLGWDASRKQYESDGEFRARMQDDIAQISAKIHAATGTHPRVWVWPYGAASGTTLSLAAANGYQVALTLEDGPARVQQLMAVPRLLIDSAPALPTFVNSVLGAERNQNMMRVVHVDLDYVYDPDPTQLDRNLDALVQRIFDLKLSTVFVQAFADPDGDGLVRELYFPNRHLPMRADLFNRVAWQLHNRAHVDVYAWMPVLALDLEPGLPRVLKLDPQNLLAAPQPDPDQYWRLSPFDARVRQQIAEIYEDLASHAFFDGLLFHDDALLGDFEDASPAALAAYRAAGFGDIADIHVSPERLHAWSRFKSLALIDFTLDLTDRVRAIRGPQIRTARNLYAQTILNPDAETWYAQNLDDFLAAYTWVAPMAMPRMENVPQKEELVWLDTLVDALASRPGALAKTVFELQARDWRKDHPRFGPIDEWVLVGWIERLQLRGVRSFGYYPDDFAADRPRLDAIRPAISTNWHPFQ